MSTTMEPEFNNDPRTLKDPVHDQITMTERMSQFIDSAAFQRLRRIKQLGTTYYVWPGASHNRFEHCIGVAHLASEMVNHLQEIQPKLRITDRDIECVTLAGLCHDLGHGPWSHVWDGLFIPSVLPEEKWTHEEGSEMMLDYLIKEKEIDIPPEDVAFIKALIAGDHRKCNPQEKRFLFDIVANKRNGLDVDKFDYLLRDSLAIGDAVKLQITRLIHSARVIDNEICYKYKDLEKVFEVYQTRHRLHKNVYNHKTARAIEYMIVDALKLAEPYMHIARRIRDPEEFLHLTDDILPEIERSTDPNLKPAQEIFKRITNRKLYRLVDMKWVTWEDRGRYKQLVTEEHILECTREAFDQLPESKKQEMNAAWSEAGLTFDDLTVDDILVEQSTLHYGMKEENPINHVKFYSKTGNCDQADGGDYSTLRPLVFAEVLLRVFTKKAEFLGIIQAGYRRLPELSSLQNHDQAPASMEVEVAEGGTTIQNTRSTRDSYTSFAPTSSGSDLPMSPPVTERSLADDGPSAQVQTELFSSRSLSRHTSKKSVMTLPDTEDPSSTAATSFSSAFPSPQIPNTTPKFVTPGASASPRAQFSAKPLSGISASPAFSTNNRFTTVEVDHGSPSKPMKPNSKKRDRSQAEAEENTGTTSVRRTRSSAAPPALLPGDREVSPSPPARKQTRIG
ncbi:hypothetical protein C8R42DRAFT_157395 [Lentinula raphanica]|nr:hypothetical protein C8R42DRAFT_157395 [Lentinula raphanica]